LKKANNEKNWSFRGSGELGRGAQSVVYLGFDPQLQREMAIKTLHFAHPDPAKIGPCWMRRGPWAACAIRASCPFSKRAKRWRFVSGFRICTGQEPRRFSGRVAPCRRQGGHHAAAILDAVAHAHAQGIIIAT
jgi:hypothetical protein